MDFVTATMADNAGNDVPRYNHPRVLGTSIMSDQLGCDMFMIGELET